MQNQRKLRGPTAGREKPTRALIATLAALEADAVDLAERIRSAMDAVERAENDSVPATYSSVDLPPGVTRQRFNKLAARIPGAVIEGRTRDRSITVAREAWHKHRSRPSVVRAAPPAEERVAPPSDEELAERMMADAGLRATGGR